ncbi:hypothetical protein B0A48_14012 [Cryoendolithus antarcticus]|uniref:Uncharacterized protein n=1 Tax=Cryoendolithus antarcticus TaxID=1507870 RepID=A0A1V8SM36_9PEZI|nr:hypothetical protein B0A48_14012 [Cryoendolithus antarcticus]
MPVLTRKRKRETSPPPQDTTSEETKPGEPAAPMHAPLPIKTIIDTRPVEISFASHLLESEPYDFGLGPPNFIIGCVMEPSSPDFVPLEPGSTCAYIEFTVTLRTSDQLPSRARDWLHMLSAVDVTPSTIYSRHMVRYKMREMQQSECEKRIRDGGRVVERVPGANIWIELFTEPLRSKCNMGYILNKALESMGRFAFRSTTTTMKKRKRVM